MTEKQMIQNKKIAGFSYLRATACIVIILLHITASASILFYSEAGGAAGAVLGILQNILMWAVPCFVMVTGALLLPKEKPLSYKKLFGKYILRIIWAILLFTFVFRIFSMFMDSESFHIGIIGEILYQALSDGSWSHMWYLYLLIGLYLLMPFYKRIAATCKKRDFIYLLSVYALFLSILPLLQIWNINVGFYIHVSTIYPFYLFLGYVLQKRILNLSPGKAALLFAGCTAAIIILAMIGNSTPIEGMNRFWGYSSILVIGQAAGIFSLFCACDGSRTGIIQKILYEIDRCSFGIYLVHMIYVRLILRYWNVNPYRYGGPAGLLLFTVVILLLSYATIWILKKIPGLKQIL